MCSNYSRPTSPSSGRSKPEYTTSYHAESDARGFEMQQAASPTRQRLALPEASGRPPDPVYGTLPPQSASQYYYPPGTYHPRRENELDPERKRNFKSFSEARGSRIQSREGDSEYESPDSQQYHQAQQTEGKQSQTSAPNLQQKQQQQPQQQPPTLASQQAAPLSQPPSTALAQVHPQPQLAQPQQQQSLEPQTSWMPAAVAQQEQYPARFVPPVQGYYQQPAPGQQFIGMPAHQPRHNVQPAWALPSQGHLRAEPPQPMLPLGAWKTEEPQQQQMLPPAYGEARGYFPSSSTGHHSHGHNHGALVTGSSFRPPPQHQLQISSNIPQLVRTSALTQASSGWSLSGYGGFEPLPAPSASSRQQAHLAIDGELADMTANWTEEELAASRRLVFFERVQEGSSIRLKFHPIHKEEYDQSTTVISCIFWKERNEFYVTSVDCITLLELIINQRFSVEEKNRVRRNLEVCKPLTISKTKQELETFFRLIMKFEPPRPRNIEKDVKVFPWNQLGHALRKIVGKYSANYVSGG